MKDNKSKSKPNNSKEKTSTTDNSKSKAELLESLASTNLSIALIYIVIISVVLSLTFNFKERAKLIDELHGITNTSDNNEYLVMSRRLALFVALISFINSIDALNKLISSGSASEKEIESANRSVLTSLLALITAKLSNDNVALDAAIANDTTIADAVTITDDTII